MQVFFEKRDELAPKIWQYFFRPERPIDFVAGQYVTFHMPNLGDDPRGKSRTFTLTSLPDDKLASFVCRIDTPCSPYKHALSELKLGDPLTINDAMGDLVLPKDPSTPLVFVAGGIGIASFVSMLEDLTKRREERPIFLFYRLQDRREQLFTELINGYPLELKTIVIKPNRLTAQMIADSTPPDALLYLSGSQRFVESLRIEFEALGKLRSEIVFDYYDGYAEL